MRTTLEPWMLRFAEAWIAAWNSHDLNRILAHYATTSRCRRR